MAHVMPGSVGFVDVADVARAHVLAARVPHAGGQRYMCSGETTTWLDVVSRMHELYPRAAASMHALTTAPSPMLVVSRLHELYPRAAAAHACAHHGVLPNAAGEPPA